MSGRSCRSCGQPAGPVENSCAACSSHLLPPSLPPPGFPNSGNQCFIIAACQALCSSLIGVDFDRSRTVTGTSGLPPVHNLVQHTARLLKQPTIAQGEASSLIKMFSGQFRLVVDMATAGDKSVHQPQEDSSEFLSLVMARLSTEQGANPNCDFGLLSLFSIRVKITNGCELCGHHRDVLTEHQGLELRMPTAEERSTSLERLIEIYQFPDSMDASEIWSHNCQVSESNEDGAHTSTASLISCPEILRFSLARFGQQVGEMKDVRPVSIPVTLNMGEFLSQRTRGDDKYDYYLNAVIIHIGRSVSNGHFVAVVRRNGQWFCCDDNSVKQLPMDDDPLPPYLRNAVAKGQVHQVFYVRGNQLDSRRSILTLAPPHSAAAAAVVVAASSASSWAKVVAAASAASYPPAHKKMRTQGGGCVTSAPDPKQANATSRSPLRKSSGSAAASAPTAAVPSGMESCISLVGRTPTIIH